MSVRFKYYLRGCGLGILVASLVFIVSLHAHGGAMSDEKAMQRASELGMIMPDDTQTQEAETQTTELPVKETNLPDTQRTTQAVTQKVPQNDTQKQTERDTSSEQNDTSKESEKKAEEKKKTQDSQKKEEEKKKAQETEKEETKKEEQEQAIWLKDNAYKYGFVIRYPKQKEDVTHKAYQPYILRYVGEECAKYMHDKGIVMEELSEKDIEEFS